MDIDQIIKQYQKLIFSICINLVKDYFEAENITQDTFVLYITKYTNPENPKALLCKIATNKCLDFLKSTNSRKAAPYDPEDIKNIVKSTNTPESIYIDKEFYVQAEELCLQLKYPYNEIAHMYYIQNLTVEEISSRLELLPKTTQTRIYRARNKLRELWKEERR